MVESRLARYRFGPLHRRGLVAGLRGGQIAAIAVGLVVAVGVLRARPSIPGALVALLAVCAGVGFATWPLRGQTAEEWTPDVVRHVSASVAARRARPDPFRGVRLVRVDVGEDGASDGTVSRSMNDRERSRPSGLGAGVLHDRVRRTFTAVCPASAPGFVLLGDEDKAGRVGAWAGVLATLARDGSTVHRLQWLERVVPGDHTGPRRHLASAGSREPGDPARDSYDALLDVVSGGSSRHEVLLAVSVHAAHAARAVKVSGGGDAGACRVLLREMASMRRRLQDASIDVGPVLGPREVVTLLREAYADRRPSPSARSSSAEPSVRPDDVTTWPWPMGMASEWSRLRADDTWHATFWIAEWPRTEVGPDFMGPLLLSSEVRRTVSVVMEPMGPLKASRQVEQARTADIADAELRRRGGFLATARRRREEEVLADRELELADGHAHYRFSGYVTVSAASTDDLEEACERVEQAAGQAGLALRRCYGDQAHAFTCTLPLGRGLS